MSEAKLFSTAGRGLTPAELADPRMHGRFYSKVGEPDGRGCRPWLAYRNATGYGLFRIAPGRSMVPAHRVAYVLATDKPVPPGLVVRHKCDNGWCVSPEHLEIGTHADNARDRDERGRNGRAKRTHCPRGHELAGGNLRPSHRAEGRRSCLSCARAHTARFNALQRGEIWSDAEFVADADRRYAELLTEGELT